MLSFNLLKVIPQRFLDFIDKGTPVNQTELLEQFSNVDLFWETSILPVEDFDDSEIVVVFCSNAQAYFEQRGQSHILNFLLRYRVPLILLCFNDLVKDISLEGPPKDILAAKGFLASWERKFQADLMSDIREPLLGGMASFYTLLLTSASLHGNNLYKSILSEMGQFPPYLIKQVKRSLLFINLHPDHKKVQFELQEIQIPRLYLIEKPFQKDRIWTSDEFLELVFRLPPEVKLQGFIKEFDKKLWKAHLFHNKSLDINTTHTGRELLAQVICLMLPNWCEIWPVMFPVTFEIQRRLVDIKKSNWLPPVKEYISVFLG